MTHADKRAQWRHHLEQWRQSGLSQSAYCARHDLKLATFRYWHRRLREAVGSAPRFIPLGGAVASEPRITLRAGSLHFDIPIQAVEQVVPTLLRCLEAARP